MKRYLIRLDPQVNVDIRDVFNKIAYGFKQPLTARRYRVGLLNTIRRLSFYGASIAPSQYRHIQSRYGPKARHITYKKMTIIYTITDDTVLIKRVMPGKLIR